MNVTSNNNILLIETQVLVLPFIRARVFALCPEAYLYAEPLPHTNNHPNKNLRTCILQLSAYHRLRDTRKPKLQSDIYIANKSN